MIRLNQVVKAFDTRVVLRGIDLEIAPGDFAVLLGANGAGKTTLMRMIATLSQPTAGTIHISDLNVADYSVQIRRYIGFVSHKTLLYDDLTGWQNLEFYARMYDLENPKDRLEAMLHQVGLWGRHLDPVRTYSRGMQQRLALARATLHDPPILLLDEPDTGLDQDATDIMTRLLDSVDVQRRTVLMTTHNLAYSLSLGNRVLVLARGKIRHDVRDSSLTVEQVRDLYASAKTAGAKN